MDSVDDVKQQRAQEQKRKQNLDQLEGEAAARQKRIEQRKAQKAKMDANNRARKRSRMVKMSGIWLVIIIAGFFAAAWFSEDVSKWLGDITK